VTGKESKKLDNLEQISLDGKPLKVPNCTELNPKIDEKQFQ